MNFEDMSVEAQEIAKDMIQYCISNGVYMGMGEGFNQTRAKDMFRIELEKFISTCEVE
mgnify:FL=1